MEQDQAQPVKRQTADARRDDVIQAAIVEFAKYGYHGGSTERIAVEARISQPYVLRLFGTKKALFMAAVERVCDDIADAWRQALEDVRENLGGPGTPEEQLEALREPCYRFVYEVVGVRLILQACAAAEDEAIGAQVKGRMEDMFLWVRRVTGATYEQVQEFWAHVMMMMVAASIGAAREARYAEWARAMLMQPSQTAEVMLAALFEPEEANMEDCQGSGTLGSI